MRSKILIGGLSVLALVGCATAPDPIALNAPLKMALSAPVADIEAQAQAGDRASRYALSFLLRSGLRGVARDPMRAEALRAFAGESTSRSMPIYVPGVKGAPGSLIYTQITTPGMTDAEAARLDMCAYMVIVGRPALGGQVCGSAAAYVDLLEAVGPVRDEMMMRFVEGLEAAAAQAEADLESPDPAPGAGYD